MGTYLHFLILIILASTIPTISMQLNNNETDRSEYSISKKVSTVLPCPDPDLIFPCECTVYDTYIMDMDCSNVTSEEQLRQIFSTSIPFNEFRYLYIYFNQYLKTLRMNDFGGATFEGMIFYNGILESVESTGLTGISSRLAILRFPHNNIHTFPFEELLNYPKLKTLDFYGNNFVDCPTVISPTIEILDLSWNDIAILPSNVLDDLPNIRSFIFRENKFTEISTGTFAKSNYLTHLDLGSSDLAYIAADSIVLNGSGAHLDINFSALSTVEVNAIKVLPGVMGTFHMYWNELTELKEEVWQPVMESAQTFHVYDNPLICGCDIAWLILNSTYMAKLDGRETCSTGDLLTDLDPSIYENLCY